MIKHKAPPFPNAATVSQMRQYFEYHEREGRGNYIAMGRMMVFSIPPLGSDTFDDKRHHVYTNLIPE